MTRNRRPAAHNPMIFRKVPKPDGAPCTVDGCTGFVLVGTECTVCAFNAEFRRLYPVDNVNS